MIERVIPEEEVPLILKQYNKIALKLVKQKEFERALEALSRSDEILDALQAGGSEIEIYFRLETAHNRAICLQRLGMLEDCGACIIHCISIIKSKQIKASPTGVAENIFQSRYICKSYIRLCAIFSQLKENEKAIEYALEAVKNATSCFQQCFSACKEQLKLNDKLSKSFRLRNKLAKQQQYKLFESPHYIKSQQVVAQALPFLKAVCQQFKKKRIKSNKGKKHFECEEMEWVKNWNIGDIMVIQPYESEGISGGFGSEKELTQEMLFEKIVLLIVSQFCVSTEIKNLLGKQKQYSKKDAFLWHKRALRNAKLFLPSSSALLAHISSTFENNFNNEIQKQESKKLEKKAQFGKTAFILFRKKIETLNPDQLKAIYRPRSSSSRLSRTIVRDDKRPNTSLNSTSTRSKKRPPLFDDKEIIVKQALGFEQIFNKTTDSEKEATTKPILRSYEKNWQKEINMPTDSSLTITNPA